MSKTAKMLVSLEKKGLLLALILFLFLKYHGVIPFRALIKAIKLKLKADRPHPRGYSTHRQTPWTDNYSSLLFAVRGRPDIRTQATYDPHGRVFLMCYSQSYEGNFCTTNFSYVWKILVNLKPKSSASPEFFKKYSLPCAPWCILRLGGAYCAFLVHKYPIYRCSGV